jgi:hypothetical protein
VVRLRYGDHVSFFRVGQVVSGYTMTTEGHLGAGLFTPSWSLEDDLSLGALLLGLDHDVSEPHVVYGTGPGARGQIVVQTRSMMEVLATLGSRVLVPRNHVAAGRTLATVEDPAGVEPVPVAQVRIFSSMLPPQTAFTSVRYADHWFWIDDEDYSSKRAFTFLLLLSALVENAGDGRAPLVTILTG